MAYCSTLENCCGVCEIGDFKYDTDTFYRPDEKKRIEDAITEFCAGEASSKDTCTYYNFFIATTKKEGQLEANKALKALGFKSREFKDRFNENILLFWTRRGLPKELKARIREQYKQERKSFYDRW